LATLERNWCNNERFGDSLDTLQHVVDLIVERGAGTTPFLAGIGGGVASGKSTFASQLAAELVRRGLAAQVISLDGYLKSNAVLAAAGLTHRKGFPESFDLVRLVRDVERMRAGETVRVPVYDHAANDVVGAEAVVAPGGVLILEGVIALAPEIAGLLHFKVFLDTDLGVARARYLERVQRVAALDPSHPLNGIPAEHRLSVLQTVWVEVNLKNFSEHILPARDSSDAVVAF
jgi:type I pantothenate kinase